MALPRIPLRFGPAILASVVLSVSTALASAPGHFDPYYSGPPCPDSHIDRTYSQFQVNLGDEPRLFSGILRSDAEGGARLLEAQGRTIELVSNSSRAEWLLGYPLLEGKVGVWARPILRPDCSVSESSLYVEAIFPLVLFQGAIDPILDIFRMGGTRELRDAVLRYRRALTGSEDGVPHSIHHTRRHGSAASHLEKALFSPDLATAERPWRVRLMDSKEPAPGTGSIQILVSGSDGSTGMFGHIAVGVGDHVFNVYPNGSDRGAPGPVPLWDYLFNAERGQALRRPTWVLRLDGISDDVVSTIDREMTELTREMEEGESRYHPTGNNCTLATLKALRRLGFKVAGGRYFTKRFPRPAFSHVLHQVPDLVESGKLNLSGAELWYIPQVPERASVGGAPNRPLLDRSRIN